MLNLVNSTTDKLQLVTSAAATVDVHASWADLASGAVTPGRTNTAISTAATTDIVATPAASTTRNIKTLHIFNKDASVSTDVTVRYNANGTTYDLWKSNLAPGEALEYIEGTGFFEAASSVAQLVPNMSIADQAVGASVTNYLTNSNLNLNGRTLRAGTVFTWHVFLSKTAAATATMTFDLRVGTAGTTADTSRGSIATGTQTAVADVGHLYVQATIRSISATGTLHFGGEITHNLAATGLGPTNVITAQATSGTFDTTATNLIFGLSLTTGASHAITVQQVFASANSISGASVGG